ncbi:lipocalin-like domain-containing protein [Ruegeria lacuscaerulensis]|uniref:lipocalin-like domain-containing protein n=1 Tax=Ruegeria lacuscaerulensis TaxID=55218 RepID=UPI00147CBD73|nr:lipocalin-like domain-containing protein [Ruegeria lacuscaerulensis]
METWQLTAFLRNERGEDIGLQFSVFRVGIVPPDAPPPSSIWEARDIYLGNVTVNGMLQGGIDGDERISRGMPGVAGFDPDIHELRIDNWSLQFDRSTARGEMQLDVAAGKVRAGLTLTPLKAPIATDDGATPFRGYSVTRLSVNGHLNGSQGTDAVSGTAWFDHIWGELPIPGASPIAWDRLQLHLDDGRDFSLIRSRRRDGGGTTTADGYVVDSEGQFTLLDDNSTELLPARLWRGSRGAYPVEWLLKSISLNLQVTPIIDEQEYDFAVPVWNGMVRAEGYSGSNGMGGIGMMQLTGYQAQ